MISVSDLSFTSSRPPPPSCQLRRAGRFCSVSWLSRTGDGTSATATSNRRCARRCPISQRHDLLEARGPARNPISRAGNP